MYPSQTNTKKGVFVDRAAETLTDKEGRLVSLAAAGVSLNASASVVQPYLLVDGGASGDPVAVLPLTPEQPVRIPLVGTCAKGDTLVVADPTTAANKGGVRVLPAAAGTYGIVGIAEEAGVDGQTVLVRPHLTGVKTTVSA